SLSFGPSASGLNWPADRPMFSRASLFQMEASPMYLPVEMINPCRMWLMGTCFSPIRRVLLSPSEILPHRVDDVQAVMWSLSDCVATARTMAPVPLVVSSLGSTLFVGLSPNEQA